MKKLLKIVLIAIFLINQSFIKQTQSNIKTELLGKWVFTESFIDPGDGNGKWLKLTDRPPKYLEFQKKGLMQGTYLTDAVTYKVIDKHTLAITSVDKKIQHYYFRIYKNILELSPTFPLVCKEGCGFRFRKKSPNSSSSSANSQLLWGSVDAPTAGL